jgi:hypothetical protein
LDHPVPLVVLVLKDHLVSRGRQGPQDFLEQRAHKEGRDLQDHVVT